MERKFKHPNAQSLKAAITHNKIIESITNALVYFIIQVTLHWNASMTLLQ